MPSGRHPGQHQVVAAMLLRADTVLLCHRSSDRAWYPDVWDLPGGHIEANEAPGDALVREIHEELGVTLSGPLGEHSFCRATEEFEMLVWTPRGWSGTPANQAPHEHDGIGWFANERYVSCAWQTTRIAVGSLRPWPRDNEGMHQGQMQATYHPIKTAPERARRQLPHAPTLGNRDEFVPHAGPETEVVPGQTPYGVVLSSSKLSLQVDRLSRISHPGYWPVALMPGGPRRTESLLAPFTA